MNGKMYSYGKQTIDTDDINAVVEVLKSDWLTQGPYVKEFEDKLADKFNAKYVTVVANGTAGLHLTGIALGWGRNDIIITSPITFLASANCILYAGATPEFVDIDSQAYTLDAAKLEEKVVLYSKKGKKIKAVVAVDYAGLPCDWQKLRDLANTYGFQLVNDNCHALAAEYQGDIGYAVKYADAVTMSFHPVKHVTTGEGGAILTSHKEVDERVKLLRSHGMTKDERLMEKNDGPWYYEMCDLGFNYRITDFQCALGISQLRKVDRLVDRRRQIARYYDEAFRYDQRFVIPHAKEGQRHSYHLYPLQIKFESLSMSKKGFFQKLREKNIIAQVHYIPVHLQPYYRNHFGFKEGDFPVAEDFYRHEVSIPMYPTLEQRDLEYIVSTIRELLAK